MTLVVIGDYSVNLFTLFSILQLSLSIFIISILILAVHLSKKWSKSTLPGVGKISEERLPKISIILPTWNEEKVIEAKLEDVENQEYPNHLLDVIIIDSASSDSTIPIVRKWLSKKDFREGEKYRIIQEDSRRGKSYSINRAFDEADADSQILMMSDVDCRLAEGALLMIANRFSDESIGAVTGRQILLNIGQNRKASEEGSYRDFFSMMRIAESRFSSTPIFHGECSAYRRDAISDHKLVENSNADDSQMAVSVIRSGYRAIYDPEITFYEVAPPDGRASKIQKVRRAQGLIRHFWRNRDMIFHRRFGNFRKVMTLEFTLHIVLPIAMVLGFIAGFSHIGLLINEFGFQYKSVYSFPSIDKLMLFSDLLVILLLSSGILGIPLPGSRLSITFFNYMITLFKAQILILSGHSLHQWQQVSAVRDILAEFDKNS